MSGCDTFWILLRFGSIKVQFRISFSNSDRFKILSSMVSISTGITRNFAAQNILSRTTESVPLLVRCVSFAYDIKTQCIQRMNKAQRKPSVTKYLLMQVYVRSTFLSQFIHWLCSFSISCIIWIETSKLEVLTCVWSYAHICVLIQLSVP